MVNLIKNSRLYWVKTLFIGAFLLFHAYLQAQEIPKVNGYVTDNAKLFSQSELAELTRRLSALDDSTSTQISIYTTLDLLGYDISQFAIEFGRINGVGQEGKNNGIVVIIKPTTNSEKGKIFIAPGYGLEGAIPDAVCKRIIENDLVPEFKAGNYFGGVDKAVVTLSKLASGEFQAKDYLKKKKDKGTGGGLIAFFIIAVFIFIFFSGGKNYGNRNNLPFWMALGLLNSMGSRHNGSYSNFNSGGGGFGGFGGGSFGGGGAGGSW